MKTNERLFREFLSRKVDEKDAKSFDEAFEVLSKIDKDKATHDKTSSKTYRSYLRRRIRLRENNITPASKQAAIKRNEYLSRFLFRYFRRFGFPANTSDLLRRMDEKGLLDVENNDGRVRTLNHRTVRMMIEDMRRPFSWAVAPRRKTGEVGASSPAELTQQPER